MQDGIPAVAFSGSSQSTTHEAWTLLTSSPTLPTIAAARAYASLTAEFLDALFSQPLDEPALLPSGVLLNVNFPPLSPTCAPNDVQWVFTRAFRDRRIFRWPKSDVTTCENGGRLPAEATVFDSQGCYATVSVLDARFKTDVSEQVQADVLQRLDGLGFSCFPSPDKQSYWNVYRGYVQSYLN